MTRLRISGLEFRPALFGLIFLLITLAGCGDSTSDLRGSNSSTDNETLARTAEEEPIEEELEALDNAILARAADVFPGNIRMGSTSSTGVSANSHSFGASLSADGRYLSFSSKASNLLTEPVNGQYQVYRKDLETGELICVSRDYPGAPPSDDRSHHPRISDDGSKIVFSSRGTNLIYNLQNPNRLDNVFMAEFAPTYPGGPTGYYQLKLLTKSLNNWNNSVQMGTNGTDLVREFAGNRFVALRSNSTDLHWDDQDNKWDLFYLDLENTSSGPSLNLLSRTNNYVKSNSTSLNTGLLAEEESGYFTTYASNMVPSGSPRPSLQFLHQYNVSYQPIESKKFFDVDVAENTLGRFAATVRNATNNGYDSYYYHFEYPGQPNPTSVKLGTQVQRDDSFDISDDGRFAVYVDKAQRSDLGDNDSLYDIYVYDAKTNTHALVTKNGPSSASAYRPVISDDGSTIAFDQGGRVYVVGNPILGSSPPATEQLVSATDSGVHSNAGWSGVRNPVLSANGRYLAFESKATNLNSDANTGKHHVYLKDLFNGDLKLVSRSSGSNQAAEGNSHNSYVTDDGKKVVFSSPLENIGHEVVPSNNFSTTYVRDLETNQTNFLFTKGRVLDVGLSQYMPDALQLYFSSYGSQNDHYNGTPAGVYEAEYPNFYPQPINIIPSWMLQQYTLQDLKVSDDGRYGMAAFTDTSVSPTRYLLYRFSPSTYYGNGSNSELLTDNGYYQDFDISNDGLTVAYTERIGGNWNQKVINLRKYSQSYGGYSNFTSYFVSPTQCTTPHLSGDGRFLLYYDTNYQLGQSSGSGSNAYVFSVETQESLPVREESVSYPSSLRISEDGRGIIFEDYDYEKGTQLYYIKNPHPAEEPLDPYPYF